MRCRGLPALAFLCAAAQLGLGAAAHAQDEEEKAKEEQKTRDVQYTVTAGFNFAQTSFVDWAEGGEDALSYVISLKSALFQERAHDKWKVEGSLGFGQTKVGDEDVKISFNELVVDGKYNYKLPQEWSAYAAAGFRSAIVTGYDYTVEPKLEKASFNDPGYYKLSLGGQKDWSQKPRLFTTRAGLGLKYTTAQDHFEFGYADDPDTPEIDKDKLETGIDSVTELDAKISENLRILSALTLFSTFEELDVWDVRWDTVIAAQINKYVSTQLVLSFLFDKDVSGRLQRFQMLGIGLTYTME